MPVRKLDPDSFVHAYNVDLQPLYPWDGVASPPFGAAWAVLAPGESTKPHAHQECESFFVARGRGVIAIGDEHTEIEAGDVSFHTPFDNHVLTNTSEQEDLLFLTVYWEDRSEWETGERRPEEAVERVLVTAAPPTPNGDLHLGHVAGPYLAADAYARFLRLQGVDARFVCGSDDNSPWVAGLAAREGNTPEETAGRLTDSIVDSLERSGVELAAFERPNESTPHRRIVREVFAALHERGAVVEKEMPTPWCPRCDQPLVEHRVKGRCPGCGRGIAGNTCEECGRTSYGDVLDPECASCGAAAEVRPVRRLVMPLAPWADALREWYRRVEMPTHLRAFCEAALARGLPDVPVTQPGEWGIEVPVEGWEDQRIYVWFEIAPRYLAYAEALAEADGAADGWRRSWKAPEARVVQFCGFDNSFYYGVWIPAVLLAFDAGIRLPDAVLTNEFYRLEGEKFSTSREHRILARDLLARVPADPVRFHLARTAPERERTNFTLDDFRVTCRRDLLEGWEVWLRGVGRRTILAFDGKAPATGDWTGEQRRFFRRLEGLLAEAGESYAARGFSLQRASRVADELVREARRFGAGEVHWDRAADVRGEERRTSIALQLLAAKVLSVVAAPILPETADRIRRALGLGELAAHGGAPWREALGWVPSGTDVSGLAEPLFPGLAAAFQPRHTPAAVRTQGGSALPENVPFA